MKRWPLIASFALFIALCVSAAYWGMQLFTPPLRAVAAPPPTVQPPPRLDAAAALFGGRSTVAVATNFQLRGVVMSGNSKESVAILAADGKPAQAVRVNAEVMPGVRVQEVHARYVLLSDNGSTKRVELPEEGSPQAKVEIGAPPVPRAVPPLPAVVPPRATVAPPSVPSAPPQAPAVAPALSAGAASPSPSMPGMSGANGVQGAPGVVPQPGLAPQLPPPVVRQVPPESSAAPGLGTSSAGAR